MTKNYTPGPWQTDAYEGSEGWAVETADGENQVCNTSAIIGPTEVSNELRRHNARLIAAAPELVEALIEALNVLDNELDQATDYNRKDYLVETIQKAKAALVKAGVGLTDK